MDDEIICKELKAGNKRILDELYACYHKRIIGFALSYLKSEEDAYDLVQEIFIGLWNNRHSLKKGSRIEPPIFTVTKNAVISLFRKKTTERKYLEYLGNSVISNNIGTQEMTDFGFLEDLYENLISQLPEKRKEIFIQSRKNGKNNKELAGLANYYAIIFRFTKFKHLGNSLV
jgi:RNA polymerase sigma-70 factor (ECF subfamily)